jgi:RNA polymerase sigma-70 factor (ECF subfamily)
MTHWDDNDVKREIPALRRYARALTRDEAAADDLVQEALVRAIERVETFQPGRSLKTWLLAIVHNQFVTGIRRQRAEERRDAAFALTQLEHLTRLDQETMLYLQQVSDLYAGLSEHHREVLHLIVVEGLSYQEAADTLQVAVGTVMSRLSRARGALRAAAENTRDSRGLHIVGGLDAS